MSKPNHLLPLTVLLVAALACSLPGFLSTAQTEITPSPEMGPTSTPLPPSPPTLVETEPKPREELPLQGNIRLYFDQAMDQPSVEAALRIEPSIERSVEWLDEGTAQINVLSDLERDAVYELVLESSARSSAGLSMEAPVELAFQTVGDLEVTQVIPQDGAVEVNPRSPITVVFNRPVVALELDRQGPNPLRFDPPLPGKGEWIDTSIYRFQPEGYLPGGINQTISIDDDLQDLSGAVLPEPYSWYFMPAVPKIISVDPDDSAQDVPLDTTITLRFNQPMNTASVERGFAVGSAQGGQISGAFEWNDENSALTFTPDDLLAYDTLYRIFTVDFEAASGAMIPEDATYFFNSVRRPAVLTSNPTQGGVKPYNGDLEIIFNSPMDPASVLEALQVTPELENLSTFWYSYQKSPKSLLEIHGDYQPGTSYTVTIDMTATDPYGTTLPESFSLSFTAGDLPPQLSFSRYGNILTYTPAGAQQVEMNVRNLSRVDFQLFKLSVEDAFVLIEDGVYRDVQARGDLLRTWTETFSLERNRSETRAFSLSPTSLETGPYLLFVDSPQRAGDPLARLIFIREIELVLKSTTEQILVWAVDLRNGESIPDAPVALLGETGSVLQQASTDQEGLAHLNFPYPEDPYKRYYIATGEPGQLDFGLTASHWSRGIQPYEFGVNYSLSAPEYESYLYTDRPMYRPGHTVRFRGILRRVNEARYALPDLTTIEVNIRDPYGEVIYTENLPISEYGTFNGQFALPDAAEPGGYFVRTEYGGLYFDVAEYRKPEFTVEVDPSAESVAAGDALTAEIHGEYFFGGAVPDSKVAWVVWADPFYMPGVPRAIDWFSFVGFHYISFNFEPFAQGEGTTDANGDFEIELPTESDEDRPQRLTIEATVTDPSDLPVTGRTTVTLHPASFYLGLVPERYAVRAGDEAVVKLTSVDWEGAPLPNKSTELTVERLVWRQTVDEDGRLTWESEATVVNRGALSTGGEGELRFSFTPEQSGTYRIRAEAIDAKGRRASSRAMVWVSGPGAGRWRRPPAGRMMLVPDRESYEPGDTARIMVPSPFDEPGTALVTLERSGILSHEIRQISALDNMLEIPIQEIHAPNVFLSVVLIKPADDEAPAQIAVGILDLEVSAQAFALDVSLTPDKEHAEPGEQVTYTLEVRDQQGRPVQGEFSLGLADLAALSLAEPNSGPPFESFYDPQRLRIRTSASLTISGEIAEDEPRTDGIGGGGGGGIEAPTVRSEFPDTAYWNPSIVTDEQGRAEVTLALPDSLTTWRMDARGTTKDTRVGAQTVDLIATKELLIRPVTPRFFTAGDAASVAAVVHNNSDDAIDAEVGLTSSGAQIAGEATYRAQIEAGGQERFEWSLTIQDVEWVDLTFDVRGGGLQDASKPTIGSAQDGALPVIRYSVPDTAATAGVVPDGGVRLEVVNLPRSFDPTQGSLQTILDPTLGAAMNSALDVLEDSPYLSCEVLVSRFLPNLAAYRAFQTLGIDAPDLQDRLERTLEESLLLLRSRQNRDGGWGWWSGGSSNAYITAYVVYGLSLAQEAGADVDEDVLADAVQYLIAGLTHPDLLASPHSRDRQVFVLYALAAFGEGDLSLTLQMAQERELLSLWAKALLAQTLHTLSPSASEIDALLSDLETAAVRSATSAHWDDTRLDRWNMGSPVRTTSHALMTLLELDPDNSLIPGVVRWLLAARARDGAWNSSHETSWALLSLVDWLEVSGSLEADYEYAMRLNGRTLASGSASPGALLSSVEHTTPVEELFPEMPNQLTLERSAGRGNLFYSAHLTVFRPVEEVEATARGLHIQREYFHYDGTCGVVDDPCPLAPSGTVGEDLLVRLTMIVPSDQYYVAVEDPYPAGAEPIDSRLLTTPSAGPPANFSEADLNRGGWGGWWFSRAAFGDEKLTLFADYLPAGTYQYNYLLHTSLSGEYRVLPPRIWAVYFPEVYGHGEGRVYTIQP